MPVSDSFHQWLAELNPRVEGARKIGVGDLKKRAEDVGDFLAKYVDPQTPEQALLKEMWEVADEQEQQAIANCMFKLAERQGSRVH
ncbi:MAG TPA: DUF3243 domain-containing protein [Bacillota bacterium]